MLRGELIDELVSRIARVERTHPARVAIDGVDASGKTTLADELAAAMTERGQSVIRSSIDGFHNPARVRRNQGDESPVGYFEDSFDLGALIRNVLEPLGPGGDRIYRSRVFDYRIDREVNAPETQAPDDAVLLFDGIFLLRPELREYWDYSVFVRASFEVTKARAEQRDLALFGNVENIRRRYEHRYVPGQQIYLRTCHPERFASVVVVNDDPDLPSIAVVS